jgi:hypothetical protein
MPPRSLISCSDVTWSGATDRAWRVLNSSIFASMLLVCSALRDSRTASHAISTKGSIRLLRVGILASKLAFFSAALRSTRSRLRCCITRGNRNGPQMIRSLASKSARVVGNPPCVQPERGYHPQNIGDGLIFPCWLRIGCLGFLIAMASPVTPKRTPSDAWKKQIVTRLNALVFAGRPRIPISDVGKEDAADAPGCWPSDAAAESSSVAHRKKIRRALQRAGSIRSMALLQHAAIRDAPLRHSPKLPLARGCASCAGRTAPGWRRRIPSRAGTVLKSGTPVPGVRQSGSVRDRR